MKKILILLLTILVCSCEEEIEFKGDYEGEKLVLYSCANPDTVLSAYVYKSVFFMSQERFDGVKAIRGARVTALVNGKDTYSFREESTDSSIRYVSEYIPRPGDHILVSAEYDGFKPVHGETDVPQPPEFCLGPYSLNRVETWISSCQIKLDVAINDPGQEENYYRMTAAQTLPESEEWRWMSIFSDDVIFFNTDIEDLLFENTDSESVIPDYFDDGAFNGQTHSFSIKVLASLGLTYIYDEDGNIIDHHRQSLEDLKAGDFKIRVENLSESLYRYSKSLDAAFGVDDIASLFGEQVSIHNNIVNGIGCVGAVSGRDISLDQAERAQAGQ